MTNYPLLERQMSVLTYLTSASAIFDGHAATDPDHLCLHGLDRDRLWLEARFSHEKRMAKVRSVLVGTFKVLGERAAALERAFVETYPATEVSKLANARQFHQFLRGCGEMSPPLPSYLTDLAACEIACAQVRAGQQSGQSEPPEIPPRGAIRRHPRAVLLRSRYDIQSLFESGSDEAAPEREVLLAVAAPPGTYEPQVLELPAALFELLAELDVWSDPQSCTGEHGTVIAELANWGLVEVQS